jgi:3-oxoadipate enol-lactonase
MTGTTVDGEVRARDGARLAFTRRAAGPGAPRVVFVHSLALDRSVWTPVARALEGRVESVVYDCRGHGASDRGGLPFSTGQFADDLADLLDGLGWPDAVAAGCSMGGCVVQHFAARHPARARGALLVDTTAWYGPTAREDWAGRAAAAREKGARALVPFQLARWFGDAFRAGNPELMRELARVFAATDPDCYAAACSMLGEADLRGSAADVRCPVRVVVGEEDGATPPAMARALADLTGAGAAVVVPGTRHLTPMEDPGAVAAQLEALLAVCGAAR